MIFFAKKKIFLILISANFSYFVVLSPSEVLASEAVALSFGAKISPGVNLIKLFTAVSDDFS